MLALSQYEKNHFIKECDFTFCRQYVHSISLFLVKYFYVFLRYQNQIMLPFFFTIFPNFYPDDS